MIDNDQGLSLCMDQEASTFNNQRRYEAAIQRAWYRALHELRLLRKDREPIAICTNKLPQREPATAASASASAAVIEIRCVSQSSVPHQHKDRPPDPATPMERPTAAAC